MKKCPYCAEDIQDDAIKCKHCHADLINSKEQIFDKKKPSCKLCGGDMKKSSEGKSQGMGCLLLLIGLFLLFLFPIGTIIGIFVLLWGINIGSKRRGLWACRKCGHQVERKLKWFELG